MGNAECSMFIVDACSCNCYVSSFACTVLSHIMFTSLLSYSKLQTGLVVYLKVDPEVIMTRIKGTDRPLLQTDDPLETLKKLTEERKERYQQADVTVEVTADMGVEKAADKCIRALHDFIDDNPPAWKQAAAKAKADGLDWVN